MAYLSPWRNLSRWHAAGKGPGTHQPWPPGGGQRVQMDPVEIQQLQQHLSCVPGCGLDTEAQKGETQNTVFAKLWLS